MLYLTISAFKRFIPFNFFTYKKCMVVLWGREEIREKKKNFVTSLPENGRGLE